MPKDGLIFLTLPEAVDAVAADFCQYGSQPELYLRIAPLILGEDCRVGRQGELLVRHGGSGSFKSLSGDGLGFYLIHVLETVDTDAGRMAEICNLVFRTAARPGMARGKPGVWIRDQMDSFDCQRCGHCCHRLDTVCSPDDLKRWERLGRRDILAWVKTDRDHTGRLSYRIWFHPGTGRAAGACPFLGQIPGDSRFFCQIQAVKPQACREYPLTLKHGQMTGCKGSCGKTKRLEIRNGPH